MGVDFRFGGTVRIDDDVLDVLIAWLTLLKGKDNCNGRANRSGTGEKGGLGFPSIDPYRRILTLARTISSLGNQAARLLSPIPIPYSYSAQVYLSTCCDILPFREPRPSSIVDRVD